MPDAPGVEEPRRIPELHESSRAAAESEDVRALDEERPVFGEELLERREVDERGVELDLPEIGIERGVEGEVRRHAVLQVHAAAPEIVVGPVVGVAQVLRRLVRPAGHAVGEQLEPPRRGNVVQADQVSEPGHEPALRLADERPHREFVLAEDRADEADPPHLLARAREAELGKRNPVLGAPAARVHAGRYFPHRVPRLIGEISVVAELQVRLDAERRDVEAKGGAVVVVAVDQDAEVVALGERVPPSQVAGDPGGLAIEQSHADVQRRGVVQDAHFRGFGDEVASVGVALTQVGHRHRQRPDRVVEPAVEVGGMGHPHGGDRGRHAVGVPQTRGVGDRLLQ